MHLGTLDLPKNQWRHLASILEARLTGQYSLTEDNQELSCLADQLIKRHEYVATDQQEKQKHRQKANIVGIDLNSKLSIKDPLKRSIVTKGSRK
jgi:hypothetical protein